MTSLTSPPSPPEDALTGRAARRILRALAAGVLAGALVLLWIKTAEPALFEGRADRVWEQCLKTGLAVSAFTLLVSLARDRRPGV